MSEVTPSNNAKDNSQVFGILGLVLPFAGMSIPGLVLAILAYNEAKKFNVSKKLAVTGIWINSVFTALGILYVIVFFGLFVVGAISVSTAP